MTNIAIAEDIYTKLENLKAYLKVDAAFRDLQGGTAYSQIEYLKKSGLLSIIVPKYLGGVGVSWEDILNIVQSIAEVDSAIAHLYAFNALDIITPHYRGTVNQKEFYYRETLKNNWFWGNAVNTKEKLLYGDKIDNRYILNGVKSFSSGSPGSDYLIIAWRDRETDAVVSGAIPSDRAGLTIHEDWDGFGQKQTGSGTVTFNQVEVQAHEVLNHESFGYNSYTITPILTITILANVFVGVAKGALEDAKQFVVAKHEGKEPEEIDILLARAIGELRIKQKSVDVFAERVNRLVSEAWDKEFRITQKQFDELFVEAAALNVLAGDVALHITSSIFDIMGARSATITNGFDRYWRNVRVHTLHDAIENKKIATGQFFLTGKLPQHKK